MTCTSVCAGTADFFHDDRCFVDAQARAPVFFWYQHCQETGFREFLDEIGRVAPFSIKLQPVVFALSTAKLSDRLSNFVNVAVTGHGGFLENNKKSNVNTQVSAKPWLLPPFRRHS